MKNQSKMLKKYRDPFSDKAKKLALKFDSAIIAQDTEKLKSLFDDAESILKEENDASKAMIYYSLGTDRSDYVDFFPDQLIGTECIYRSSQSRRSRKRICGCCFRNR